MAIDLTTLDAHEQPSDELRGNWKRYSRTDHAEFIEHPDIDDVHHHHLKDNSPFKLTGHIPSDRLAESFKRLEGPDCQADQEIHDAPIYVHPLLPGMLTPYPSCPDTSKNNLVSHPISRPAHYPLHNPRRHTEGVAVADGTQRPKQPYASD